jgi:hypothetical protein
MVVSARSLRWLLWTQVLVLALSACFWGEYLTRRSSLASSATTTDFLGIYLGARAVAVGGGRQLYDLQFQHRLMDRVILPYRRGKLMPFVYPGYVAVLLRPLGTLDFAAAYMVWLSFNVAITAWAAIRLSALFAGSLSQRWAVCLTFLVFLPLQLSLWQGQLGILPAFGILQALLAFRSGHEWRGGWWLSLGLLKPQLILFPLLVFALWRCWRTLLAFSIALAGTLAFSIFALGLWFENYLHFLAEYNRRGAELSLYPSAMQNWRGLISSLLGTGSGPAFLSAVLVLSLGSLFALAYVCAPVSASRSRAPASGFATMPYREARYATAVLLGLLSSPHLYLHDWVVALPMGIILWSFAREARTQDNLRSWTLSIFVWLLALSPLAFFLVFLVIQFSGWSRIQTIPVYMGLLTAALVISLGKASGVLTPLRHGQPLPEN